MCIAAAQISANKVGCGELVNRAAAGAECEVLEVADRGEAKSRRSEVMCGETSVFAAVGQMGKDVG
jgi:hypothetical protein